MPGLAAGRLALQYLGAAACELAEKGNGTEAEAEECDKETEDLKPGPVHGLVHSLVHSLVQGPAIHLTSVRLAGRGLTEVPVGLAGLAGLLTVSGVD